MKLYDIASKKMYRGTMVENYGDHIKMFNLEREEIASIPSSQAKLIFNERELPTHNQE